MGTPSEKELYPEFDERIYDLIERNPVIINENWPFDVDQERRDGESVMGLVMKLDNWERDRPPAAAGARRPPWASSSS